MLLVLAKRLARKSISDMTYLVSSWMLNLYSVAEKVADILQCIYVLALVHVLHQDITGRRRTSAVYCVSGGVQC